MCLQYLQQQIHIRKKQRRRDGIMNEFLFWCRHPLVPLLFHEVTSLHPPSFQRNGFSTCVNRNTTVPVNHTFYWSIYTTVPINNTNYCGITEQKCHSPSKQQQDYCKQKGHSPCKQHLLLQDLLLIEMPQSQ